MAKYRMFCIPEDSIVLCPRRCPRPLQREVALPLAYFGLVPRESRFRSSSSIQ